MREGTAELFPERVQNHDHKLKGLLPSDVQSHGFLLLINQLAKGDALQVLRLDLGNYPG